MTLADLLNGDDDDVVVHRDDVAITRIELRERAERIARELAGREGHAVGVCMPNTEDAIAAWFGVWQVGAAFVPLNPRVPATERVGLIERTGVSAVVGERGIETCRPREPRVIAPGDAIIQFTSGTTGAPKAVPLRHDTVQDLIDSVLGSLRRGNDGRARMPNLVPVSLSLWAGIYQVLFAFRLGVPVVLMERFEPKEFARLVARYEIKSSVLPPAALVMLNDDPAVTSLAPLRYVRSVSAPLSPAHARRFHERFGVAILNGYGQTELGGEAIGWTAADWKEFGATKLGAVGRPHRAFAARVRDGELELKSEAAVPPTVRDRLTEDGWLRTGDLARIDDDGFVWIEGRVSDMINRGGMKVFPDEVEECIRALPGVADAAVAGVPDDRLGEVPWAFVVPAAAGGPDLEAIQAGCRAALAPYKVPVGMTELPMLPRNEIGKLLRQDLIPRARPG